MKIGWTKRVLINKRVTGQHVVNEYSRMPCFEQGAPTEFSTPALIKTSVVLNCMCPEKLADLHSIKRVLTMVVDYDTYNHSRRPAVVTEVVSISKFKATCLALLKKVKRTGQPILVTRKGEPVAQVVPPPPPKKPESWLGSLQSTGQILGDIVSPAIDEKEWEVLC